MNVKKCCVTGHRNLPAGRLSFVEKELRKEILRAIEDGYTHFISGFADGIDLLLSSIVVEIKQNNPHLQLEAAIPFVGIIKTKDKKFHELFQHCDKVSICFEKYSKFCFIIRNRYMVDNSDRIIAVYDNRNSGGTFSTINYAYWQERDVRIIKV